MAESIAGPSRAATVQDEAEEGAASTVVLTNGNGTAGDDEEEVEELGPDGLPKNASPTLYLQNLNEKVGINVMKTTLASLFKPYRPIMPITAHRNVRMRGQAFVSFRDKKSADAARRDVNEFPLYGKPVVSRS